MALTPTDHRVQIAGLRGLQLPEQTSCQRQYRFMVLTAADLLEAHDRTTISLDHWSNARQLVEDLIGMPITENGAP